MPPSRLIERLRRHKNMQGASETVRLPSTVYDDSLGALISQLISAEQGVTGVLVVDFQDVQFYVPAALTTLLATVSRWSRTGRMVSFVNVETCPALGYLQRMDFFSHCGVPLTEGFRRHDVSGRFLPLCRIDGSTSGSVDKLCEQLARCVFPDLAESEDLEATGPFDMLQYAASELINNVIQHARGPGYVAAQVYPKSGLVRLAVVDAGIGVRQSFAENLPPFWDPKMTDLDAVRTALRPKVSSKMHLPTGWGGPVNAGVGLSMLKEVAKHADGLFTLISGNGFYQHNHLERRTLPSELNLAQPYPGTICALQLSKQKLGNLQKILQDAKKGIGLIQPDRRFDNLFE